MDSNKFKKLSPYKLDNDDYSISRLNIILVDRYLLLYCSEKRLIIEDLEEFYKDKNFNHMRIKYEAKIYYLPFDMIKSFIDNAGLYQYKYNPEDLLKEKGFDNESIIAEILYNINSALSSARHCYYKMRRKAYDVSGKFSNSGAIYTDNRNKELRKENVKRTIIKGITL